MSAANMAGKRWGDVEDDDDEGPTPQAGEFGKGWETKPDADGIKSVIDYANRDGKTFRVTKRVKQTVTTTWTNRKIQERKEMAKFGKAKENDAAKEKALVVQSEEDIPIEFSKRVAQQVNLKDEAEDKFYEESLTIAENMNKQKTAWTQMNKARQEERDQAGVERPEEPDKPAETQAAAAAKPGAAPAYVPPSLRNAGETKGKGKGSEEQTSLRVTNLSEDCREGDLQELFGDVGRGVSRVYIAKDPDTKQSRGFAFVTYHTRADAEKAVQKLDGHPYDNLILRVQFAKPKQ